MNNITKGIAAGVIGLYLGVGTVFSVNKPTMDSIMARIDSLDNIMDTAVTRIENYRNLPEPAETSDTKPIVASDPAIERGTAPEWYKKPQTEFQKYAKTIADKYPSICYEEAIVLTYSIQNSAIGCDSASLPDTIPFQIQKNRRKCFDYSHK
jgi:hypothetical protein